jgi:hypothetical protein
LVQAAAVASSNRHNPFPKRVCSRIVGLQICSMVFPGATGSPATIPLIVTVIK